MLSQTLRIILLLTLAALTQSTVIEDKVSQQNALIPQKCDHEKHDDELMLVSLMNGRIEAYDSTSGNQLWSLPTGEKLLSTSISNIEVIYNGVPVRLIPSLDGLLFRFHDDVFEPLPLTADTLLSSSFKVSTDSTVVGGKDVVVIGIDPQCGQVYYRCDRKGCNNQPENTDNDRLIIKHETHTIRAASITGGQEKWNLSVGHHDVKYIKYTSEGNTNSQFKSDEWVENGQCEENTICDQPLKINNDEIYFDVARGLMVKFQSPESTHMVWRKKLSSPISRVWKITSGNIDSVDLLNSANILQSYDRLETLTPPTDKTSQSETNLHSQPDLFLGSYEGQVYIQTSEILKRDITKLSRVYKKSSTKHNVPNIQIKWAPYIQSSPTRTPYLNWKQSNSAREDEPDNKQIAKATDEKSLSVLSEFHPDVNYPYDSGFYLKYHRSPIEKLIPQHEENSSDDFQYSDVLDIVYVEKFVTSWKQIFGTALISVIGYIITRRLARKYRAQLPTFLLRFVDGATEIVNQIVPPDSDNLDPLIDKENSSSNNEVEVSGERVVDEKTEVVIPADQYISRYESDFEQVECLGRGGFGVVFHARNKMDECDYAIKRIAIEHSVSARDKVMREVKALAKLDHSNIVRYHQSWFENPPPGWQEKRDLSWLTSSDKSITGIYSAQTPIETNNKITPKHKNKHKKDKIEEVKPIRIRQLQRQDSLYNDRRENTDSLDIVFTDQPDSLSDSYNRPVTGKSSVIQASNGDESSYTGHPFFNYNKPSDTADRLTFGSTESFSPHLESWGDDPELSSLNHAVKPSIEATTTAGTTATVSKSTKPKRPKQRLFLYIQMQLCKKETLSEYLSHNTLRRNLEEMYSIFRQICEAVEYIHNQSLIHRDLKPSNIFFSSDGTVRVGDFGLVTALHRSDNDDNIDICDSDKKMILSPSGKALTDNVGTYTYMSPEQINGYQYDSKVDIYALGLILFELLYPFSTYMERSKTLHEIKNNKFPDRFSRELPDECSLVGEMISQSPDDRPSITLILEHPILVSVRPTRRRTRSQCTNSLSTSSTSTVDDSERSQSLDILAEISDGQQLEVVTEELTD